MNKEPAFRIFVIIVLGIILFQMIFRLITGGTDMDNSISSFTMGNTKSSLDSLVTGLIVLLVKFLIVALLISILLCVCIWLKKNFLQNLNLSLTFKQNPMFKSILSITAMIIGLILLIYVYNYMINPSVNYSNYMTNSYSMTGTNVGGFSGALGITGVLTFLVKVLTYVFVISLIISLMAFLKNQIDISGFQLFKTANPKAAEQKTSTTGHGTQETEPDPME